MGVFFSPFFLLSFKFLFSYNGDAFLSAFFSKLIFDNSQNRIATDNTRETWKGTTQFQPPVDMSDGRMNGQTRVEPPYTVSQVEFCGVYHERGTVTWLAWGMGPLIDYFQEEPWQKGKAGKSGILLKVGSSALKNFQFRKLQFSYYKK